MPPFHPVQGHSAADHGGGAPMCAGRHVTSTHPPDGTVISSTSTVRTVSSSSSRFWEGRGGAVECTRDRSGTRTSPLPVQGGPRAARKVLWIHTPKAMPRGDAPQEGHEDREKSDAPPPHAPQEGTIDRCGLLCPLAGTPVAVGGHGSSRQEGVLLPLSCVHHTQSGE